MDNTDSSGVDQPAALRKLRIALSSSPELLQLDPAQRRDVLAALEGSWQGDPGGSPPRLPVVLAQALGGHWPSRVHAGLTEDPGAPIAPHQLPHLLDAVNEALGSDERGTFLNSVITLVQSQWP